jgi:hypothetical protein
MNTLSIDRLILNVPGLSESDGRRLAQQVADGLGSARFVGGALDIPTMNLELRAGRGESLDELARQIVAEFARQVRQLP